MNLKERISQAGIAIAVFVVLVLIVGQLLGQPVLLSYVETESMSPTMEPGDGFVPIPTELAGSVQTDDVIVFEAAELHGGELTTHRVVDETERGYITRGDGNPVTDQDGTEPPVTEPQIVAKALQVNGHVVVIPQFGTAVERIHSVVETIQRQIAAAVGIRSLVGTQGLAASFFVATLVWYVIGARRDETRSGPDRTREIGFNTRAVVAACALLLVLTATMAMVAPSGPQEYGIVSASFDSEKPHVIPQGESNEVDYPVDNNGLLPIVSYVEPASNGVTVESQTVSVHPRTVETTAVTLDAPAETGYYRRYVVEHRYLAVLPSPVIQTLYRIHPWAPIAVINAMIGIPFYLFGRTLLGTGRIRNRRHSRDIPLTTRLRRVVARLYRT